MTELNTGISFRAYSLDFSSDYTSLRSYRSSLTYVTGSHAFNGHDTAGRAGGHRHLHHKDTFLIVRNGPAVPGVGADDTVYHARAARRRSGVYGQDTWTIKRLTVNAGLRWDYLNNKVGAQDAPGGTSIGPRHSES